MKLFYNRLLATAFCLFLTTIVFAQTDIYSQNFENSTSLPVGWSQSSFATDSGWKVGTTATLSSTYFVFPAHTNFIATNDDACQCNKDSDLLKTAPLDLRGNGPLFLSFDSYFYHENDGSGHTETATVKVSIDSGATWTVLDSIPGNGYTIWVTRYISLGSYANDSNVMIGFEYSDGGGNIYGWAIDNVQIFKPATADLAVVKATPLAGSLASFGSVGDIKPISLIVFNNSGSTVTSFNGNYTVDGVTTNQKFYSSIAPYTYDTTIFNLGYTITSAGSHTISIAVNIANDDNLSNDSTSIVIGGAAFQPNHTVAIEELGGCWCGWCPAGSVLMDSFAFLHPGNTALISVHDDLGRPNTDAMAFSAYDLPLSLMASGYPTVFSDRKSSYDPAPYLFNALPAYSDHINDFGVADVTVTQDFNPTNRISTVNVVLNFAVNTTNTSANVACVFTEDGVHGITSDYNQSNYYCKADADFYMNGDGHNWQNSPAVVPASQMTYNYVARAIIGGFTGTPGDLPATIVAGTAYNTQFKYTIPSTYNENNMKVIVLLINPITDEIFNASSPQSLTGINDVKSNINQLSIYPNPTADNLNVLFTLSKPEPVVFEIRDLLGRLVTSVPYNTMAASNQKIQLPVSNLTPGIYMLNIKTSSGVISSKFIKE